MKSRKSKKERGIALLIALFALMLLSAIALAMMFMADTETAVNANYRSSHKAYFASRAGLEEVRERMMSVNVGAHKIGGPTVLPGPANSIFYVLNPLGAADVITPTLATNPYFDDELCHENFVGLGPLANPGPGIPCAAGPPAGAVFYVASDAPFTNTSGALDYKWVRITLKANGTVVPYYVNGSSAAGTLNTMICFDGTNEVLLPVGKANCAAAGMSSVFLLTGLAVTPTGARRMVQVELAGPPHLPVVAAVYSVGASTPGSSFNVDGKKEGACPTSSNVYAVASTSTVTLAGGTGGNFYGSPSSTSSSMPPPFSPNGLASWLTGYATPLPAAGTGVVMTAPGPPATYTGTAATLGGLPTVTLGGSGTTTSAAIASVSNWGAPQIYVANGNLTLGSNTSSASGNGILVVYGDLTINVTQGFKYYGLILTTGKITITGNMGAASTASVNGAMVAGTTFDATGVSAVSGSFAVQQDPCFVDNAFAQKPLVILANREEMY